MLTSDPAEESLDAAGHLVNAQLALEGLDVLPQEEPPLQLGRQGVHAAQVDAEAPLDEHCTLPQDLPLLADAPPTEVAAEYARDHRGGLLLEHESPAIAALDFAGQQVRGLIVWKHFLGYAG